MWPTQIVEAIEVKVLVRHKWLNVTIAGRVMSWYGTYSFSEVETSNHPISFQVYSALVDFDHIGRVSATLNLEAEKLVFHNRFNADTWTTTAEIPISPPLQPLELPWRRKSSRGMSSAKFSCTRSYIEICFTILPLSVVAALNLHISQYNIFTSFYCSKRPGGTNDNISVIFLYI
jgi:hypothetical protein